MANCFPALVDLVIRECPELAGSVPMLPYLKLLKVIYSEKIPLGSISGLTSLVSLKLKNYSEEEHGHDPLDSFLPHEIVALKHLQCFKDFRIRGSHKVPLVWRHEDDEQDEESSGHSSLEYLRLQNCDWIFSWPGYDGFWTSMASLKSLNIGQCNALVAFPYNALQGLKSLRELSIWNCNNMTDKSPATDSRSSFLPQLEELYLDGCSRLEKVPSIWGPSLKTINIGECESLVSLAAAEQELRRLTSLESLIIHHCPKLKYLASRMDGLTDPVSLLPALKSLIVAFCPELGKKCARGGEYWSLLSNVPELHIASR